MDKYEAALERAKKWFNSPNTTVSEQSCIKEIFPELKESEDERIRKAITALIEFALEDKSAIAPGFNETKEEALDWLEKQGNTNETINRDEFAQGVLRGAAINLITWIDYNVAKGNMCLSNMECKDIEDALVSGDWDKIYAYMKKKLENQGEQKPANVEEVNYFADFRNSDVEVDSNEDGLIAETIRYKKEKQGEQKPVWSEEDEKILKDIITDVKFEGYNNDMQANSYKKISWLKALKDRVQPQPKQEWSEEDKKMINAIYSCVDSHYDGLAKTSLLIWLKSLRPQNTWKPSDAQVASINCAVRKMKESACYDSELVHLLQDLKKLREE